MPIDPAALSPEKRALLQAMLRKQGVAAPAAVDGIPRRDPAAPAPLSYAQERLWFLHRMEPGSTAYNFPIGVRLRGAIDADALARALAEIVARHEALRTVFRDGAEGAEQVVLPAAESVALAVEDLSALDAGARAAAAEARFREESAHPFDLAAGPLYRFALLRLAADEHVLLLTFHHAVTDGWSQGVLFRELSALYAAFSRGEASPLAPLPVQYADFAAWQRAWLAGGVMDRQLAFWRGALAGAPAVLELPTDRPRGVAAPRRAARARAVLAPETWARVEALARAENATPYMVMLAAFALLLSRYSGQDDVVVGSPVAGRTRQQTEEMIGFFINSLPMRADLSGDPAFRVLLSRVREAALGAFAHQDVPFERLVAELAPEREAARAPLFQVMFALQNADEGAPSLAGLQAEVLAPAEGAPKFDLLMTARVRPDGIHALLEYAAELWEPATADRMLAHFGTLLDAALAAPDAPVSALPLLGAAERAAVDAFAVTAPARDDVPGLLARIGDAVLRAPQSPAVVADGETVTYAELDARANRLARRLRALGVARETRVGICLERGAELVVAVLAVLRAGGAYVPIDPAYPADRRAYMLGDGAAAVLVTTDALAAEMEPGAVPVLRVDADAEAIAAESAESLAAEDLRDALAYVVYTSGSTGRPKGVQVTHRGLLNLVEWYAAAYGVRADDRTTLVAGVGFDASAMELWTALAAGAALHVPSDALRGEPAALQRWLLAERITISFLPTPLAEAVLPLAWPADAPLRWMLTGGDALRIRPRADLPFRLGNNYGPTETAVVATWDTVGSAGEGVPGIGRAVHGARAYVLDSALRPVPVGVPGELCIGGAGVARGYGGKPSLTAAAFVPDPAGEPGARMYRTGDRVRWTADGTLEFLGRIDAQVKIRGFRIEPGEVEAVLLAHPAVREGAVTVRDDGPAGKRLVAYAAGEATADEIRAFMRVRLPEYMVPAAVVLLDALPVTANGKTDRKALPAPDAAADDAEFVAPGTETERMLAGVWAQLLGAARVGAGDDFFALGGHSLLATRVVSRIRDAAGVELPLRTLFEVRTLAGVAAAVDALRGSASSGSAAPAIVPVDRAQPLALSFAQERLWFLDQMEPGSAAYNVPAAWRLSGALDVPALESALTLVVARHEALRTVFRAGAAGPEQVIVDASPVRIALADLSDADADAREAEMRRRVEAEAAAPFDLGAGPLYRFAVLRMDADQHVLLITLHHAVTDGWSMGVLYRELSAAYAAAVNGADAELPALAVQYADYAAWQRAALTGDALDAQLAWWRERLAGAPALLELPTDRARGSLPPRRAARVRALLPRDVPDAVDALARAENATPYMVLLAAFQALLGRYAGQDDVVVGSPVAGRTRAETEALIGFFVNTLPVRGELGGDPAFRALLGRVRDGVLGAFAHQDVPFERLVAELAPDRAGNRAPLFQAIFALQTAESGAPALPGITAEPVAGEEGQAKVDLVLGVSPRAEGLAATLEYAAELWDGSTAERMLAHFGTLLRGALAAPDAPLSALPLLDAAERAVVDGWSGRETPFPRATADALFAQVAAASPDAVALEAGDERITYAQLDARANRLARHLRAAGVVAGTRVGLSLERGAELVVGTLAILKAGGAYVPLDPAYPAERLAFMLADTRVPVLVTDSRIADRLPAHGAAVVRVDADADAIAARSAGPIEAGTESESVAYVMYTSGSTGRPKGIEVPHRGIVRLVRETDFIDIAPSDVFLQLAPASFDAATLEIWGPLLNGARLAVHPPEQPSVEGIAAALERHGVTVLWLTAGLFNLMVEERIQALGGVRRLLAGGDVLSVPHVRRVLAELPGTLLINGYGPTENTTFTCCHPVRWLAEGATSVPVGRPVANTRVYVLDARMQPVPAGVPGELYTGGAGLALGYLNRPELTAATFVASPFVAGERLYRTGDRVRWLADGTVEFLGRIDTQVKIRGFRIEPGEIETVLLSHPAVRDAAVVVREDAPGDRRLVAYAVGADAADEVRAFLRERLPDYMVPSAVVPMDALPLTPNGKLDRRALPAPEWTEDAGYVAPRTPQEEVLAGIVAAVLGVERVGAHDDFFALGGHSLLATRAVSRIREAFSVDLPLRALFESPTVAGIAAAVDAARGAGSTFAAHPILPVDGGEPLPLSFAQERLWILHQMDPGSVAYNVPIVWALAGALDVRALETALTALVARHEALRTVFRAGPDGRPEQVIRPARAVRISIEEVSAADADRRAAAEFERAFDLSAGPLFRAHLLRLATDEHRLLLTFHHAVTDGWSLGVLHGELSALYAAAVRRADAGLPALPVRYADYAAWQRAWLAGGVLDAQLAYWHAQLDGAPALLDLPADRPRPAVRTGRGARVRLALPRELLDGLNALSRREGATLYMTLLAAFQAMLARWSGQPDVVVGSPIAGRTRAETEGLVGFFVNSLALRADLSDDPTFREALHRVRAATLGAYAHQDVPFERLVEALQPERSLSHAPLFQVMFALQNAEIGALQMPGLRASLREGELVASKLDLTVHAMETAAGLELHGVYASDLFDAATVERALGWFGVLLRAVVADPSARVGTLPLLGDAERAQVVQTWNATARGFGGEALLHRMIEAQAARTPDAVAVVHEDAALTYAQLDARANRVARRLRAMGVGAEDRVAICLERSAETVAALLGVLKAGAAYVPVDPKDPADRAAWLLEDSRAAVVITAAGIELPAHGAQVLRTESVDAESAAPVENAATPSSAAYVIYTSGSTGRPKGVVVEHRNIANYVHGILAHLAETPCRSFATVSTFSADLGNTVVFPALCSGGALHVIATERTTDPDAFAAYVQAHGIECLKIVPSHMQALMGGADPAAALPKRLLILGGEASRTEWIDGLRSLAPEMRVMNHYGPTETTVGVLTLPVAGPVAGATLPLGSPLPNVVVYVLDAAMQPMPAGVPGELYVGGAQVARGYLGRPELTAERFVASPFVAGDRLYRTGDRARWLADGTIEFLGRVDDQVKIRGFRVEPGEVASVLAAHPQVREAAVVVREDAPGDRRLVAYTVGDAAPSELRAYLKARLPEAMVPAAFVALDAIPLTRNGKLDRRALPAPEAAAETERYVAPRTPTEEVLAGIWAELLGTERVGSDDGFFDLGGHSLLGIRMVSRVRAAFGVEVPLKTLFESPTLTTFAGRIDAARGQDLAAVPPMVRVDRNQPLPLSFAQQRLWFLQQMEPASTSYNMPYSLRLTGALDVRSLERALEYVVARHEPLRTRFAMHGDEPVQVIDAPAPFTLSIDDLSAAADPRAQAQARAAAEAAAPFDLHRGPLFRARLLRIAPTEHVLLICAHHAVCDGWSLDVLFRELAQAAAAFAEGREPSLPALPVQYADFAAWQRAWLAGGEMDRQLAHWRAALAGTPGVLELPTDRARPAQPTHAAAAHAFTLPGEIAAGVRALARREGATPFMVLLAAFQLLLARYAGQDDVVVGAPVAGRNRAETEGQIGFFVNTLPLRAELGGNPGFRALLGRVRAATLDAHAAQDVPLERIVEAAGVERAAGRAPLFQAMFVMLGEPREVAMPGVQAVPAAVAGGAAKFDLSMAVRVDDDALACSLEYAAELWDAATMQRMGEHFGVLLAAALADPETPVLHLPILPDAERATLAGWARTPGDYPAETAVALFDAQAARTPDTAALLFRGEPLAYAQLHARANRLAHHLRGLGVGVEDRVGVCLERTPELVVALLAVMKAGAAYIPIDPAYPADRIDLVLEDAGARAMVTTAALAGRIAIPAAIRTVRVDADAAAISAESAEAPVVPLDAENLAHVIYTSGSTGRPKGVMIRHGAVAAFLRWMHARFPMAAGERVVGSTSVSFDVSVAEIHFALTSGATLVLVDNALSLAEPGAMAGAVQASMVPAAAAELLRMGALPGTLRRLNLAGEALAPDLARALYAAGVPEVHDLYGPTEDTTYATHAHVAADVVRNTLGRPLGGRAAYVLDAQLRPTPAGVPGEIWLAGRGLARGYLGNPGMTAERFLPDPFAAGPGARMYRTGDRGRWLATGTLEYLGRADFQVKVRGFRIEPGEIEVVLRQHPLVGGAVVMARREAAGGMRLVAYVTPAQGIHPAADDLRAHLAARLPEFMVPAAFVGLDAFPQTPNGKLDRKALPEPEMAAGTAEHAAPTTPDEERLAAIWADVLQRDRVGIHDDFFALGGHSLLATRVVARAREAFGVDVPLRVVFERPTVAGMAAALAKADEPAAAEAAAVDIVSRGTAAQLLDRIDELSDEEMDRLLATLSLDGEP